MGKRIRLGLIFSVNENWIGGTYYILNLLSALSTLPRQSQPIVTILSKRKSDYAAAKKTGYPFLHYHNPFAYKRNFVEAAVNELSLILFKKDLIDKRISSKKINILFPAINDPCFDRISRKIYWFPDFQHIFYPEFFSAHELDRRNEIIRHIATGTDVLVLSSQAAKRDWDSINQATNCTVRVIPFAVTHLSIQDLRIEDLLKEFQIEKDYFIISNQFWKHKNHLIVLKAIAGLRKQGLKYQFVFTGKEDDVRDPGYFESLKTFITENNLISNIKLLGLIDRRKQLKLMSHAKAVIQPSLYEGWSTVIEDAKSLGKLVIASDIPVHREQLNYTEYFFNPHDVSELVEKIEKATVNEDVSKSLEYKTAVKVFAQSFIDTLKARQ